MNDRAARIALMLALPSLVVATFVLCGEFAPRTAWLNHWRAGSLGGTLFFCAIVPAIWWRYVPRDSRVIRRSGALAALVLGQVLLWRPVWAVGGCVEEDILRTAQSLCMLGIWVAGIALTWWGLRGLRNARNLNWTATKGAHPMTPTAARLVIGFSLMPVLPGMFFLAGTLINSLLSPGAEWTSFLAYQCSAAILLATWLGIWRSRIEWTPARRLRTLVLATLVVVSPASVFIPDASTLIDMLRDLTPLLMVAVWFAGTALLWRKPDSPRKPAAGTSIELPDDTVRCPKCGYSLNGLREVRCPECGWTSTLDDLVLRSLAFSEDM